MVERQTGNRIKAVRSDNGGEYINKQLNEFFENRGIVRQLSVPYTPQQNGVAERANRTLVGMARSLVHSGMPDSLWAEAVATAAYLRNRAPTRALSNETPYEAWYGKKPSVHHLKVFGSVAVALDKTHHKKFQQKGKQYIMVGYSLVSKAYRLYDAELRKVVEKRDVLFDEASCVEGSGSNRIMFDFEREQQVQIGANNNNNKSGDKREVVNEKDSSCESDANDSDDGVREISSENDAFLSADEQQVKRGPGRPMLIRTGMPGRPKKKFNVLNTMDTSEIEVPETYEAAMAGKQAAIWKKAMDREHQALT